MAEEPLDFDVSSLDGLAKIKSEQQSLRDLAQRAAEHREKVTEVYTRVVRDYESRVAALEEQAQRLRAQLREEFAKLEARYGDARQALDQARFDLQESEFRKEIGEYTAEEFQRRQQAIEGSIAGRQRDLERIGQLRKRFLELLGTDVPPAAAPAQAAPAVVAAPAGPAAPPVAAKASGAAPSSVQDPGTIPPVLPLPTPQPITAPVPPLASPAATGATAVPVTARTMVVPPERLGSATPPPPASGIGETMVLPPPGSAVFRMPPMPASVEDGATQILPPPADAFATVPVPAASLVEEKAGGPPVTHKLGRLTTIGRTPDNQVVIPSREVSRKHAEVILGDAGFAVRDLGSPNGTFVNGRKVTEQPLKNGDKITVAGVTFVFKS